jgi:diguanylate cyclase (GGDEF)-like protein/putative nucleotidyltransferase with HDIG domain
MSGNGDMRDAATKLYLSSVFLMGGIVVVMTMAHLSIADPVKFVCFCALALISALMKVKLPGITGTLSVTYVVVLIGIADLSVPECMVAGLMAATVQCFFLAKKRPTLIQALFNVTNVAIAIAGCAAVYSSGYLHEKGLGLPMLLTLASVTYFALNTLAVTAIISLTESKPLLRVWKECYLWSFPFFFMGAGFAWGFHLLAAFVGWQIATLTMPCIYIVYAAYRFYLGRLQNETLHAQNMASLHLRTIEALALAIDAKDQTTHDHLQRVQVYATEIARELNLSGAEIEAIQAASVLHDIGKLAVPEHIISKPGKLTPEEFEKMKIHPVVGAEILERVQFPYPVVPIVRHHHEKWDGSGYPDGLKGEEIPVGARILAAVDGLDALASDRQYRKALPLDEAMQMIKKQAGLAFDPKIVALLENRYRELEAKARIQPVTATGLSINVPVGRGDAPDAGFEETRTSGSAQDKISFLTSIAAARQEVQTLFELSGDLGNSLCMTDTLAIFASRLKTLIPHDLICIYTCEGGVLHANYVAGKERQLFSSLKIPVGEGLSGWVAKHNSSVVNGNPAVEPGYLNDPAVITNLKSALAIPLEEDGSAIGVISLYSVEQNAFSRDHLRVLHALGPRLGSAMSNGRKLSEARDIAVTDYLTGLPNSRSLYLHLDEELARSRRKGTSLGVLLCDLDGFKKINDEHGHLEGDHVLKAVSAALKHCCRSYDYVARMGGDEFVVVLPDTEAAEVEESVIRFRTAVEAAGVQLGFPGLSLSIGANALSATSDEAGAASGADAILAEADKRMYANKRRRKAAEVVEMPRLTRVSANRQTPVNPATGEQLPVASSY